MNSTRIAGAILAGGRGVRIGGGKALVSLLGEPMIAYVAAALRRAVERLAVIGDQAAADMIDAPLLCDKAGGIAGPLAGVVSALEWASAESAKWLVIVPCDTPLLPPDVVSRLLEGAEAAEAPLAFATTLDGVQPLVSIWRSDLGPRLDAIMADGHPPVQDVMSQVGAAPVWFDDAIAFFNVNTPADLAEAEELLGERRRAAARWPHQRQ